MPSNRKQITLVLTEAETRGLFTLATLGGISLEGDPAATRAKLGPPATVAATRNALKKLREVLPRK